MSFLTFHFVLFKELLFYYYRTYSAVVLSAILIFIAMLVSGLTEDASFSLSMNFKFAFLFLGMGLTMNGVADDEKEKI